MTTLMRNGRDRRLGKPVKCHARKERVFLVGTRSADHIRASGHSGRIQRPDTWLHPNASLKRQIPLAPRAPPIHGTFETHPLAAKGRIPAIYPFRDYVDVGGLMAYSVDLTDISRRLANLIDKSLKGANPGDIPFYQPTKFALSINLKTAKALGLEMPAMLLGRADEVIE